MGRFNKTMLSLTLPILAGSSFAAPVVIASDQTTVSSKPYLNQVSVNPQALLSHIPKSQLLALSKAHGKLDMQTLPVKTDNMTPGIVKPHKISMPYLPAKVFLVGSDQLSQRWLKLHKTQLVKMKAVGLLVQVKNETELQEMQTLAKPLPLIPVSGEQVGKRLNLKHYPVLISNDQVDQ